MPTSINKHQIDEREVQTCVDVGMNSYMENVRDLYCLARLIDLHRQMDVLEKKRIAHLVQLDKYRKSLDQLESDLESLRYRDFMNSMSILCVPLFIFIGWTIAQNILVGIIFGIYGVISSIMIPYCRKKRRLTREIDSLKNIIQEITPKHREYMEEINALSDQCKVYHKRLKWIREFYFTVDILSRFERDIIEGRASTLKEAVDKYTAQK